MAATAWCNVLEGFLRGISSTAIDANAVTLLVGVQAETRHQEGVMGQARNGKHVAAQVPPSRSERLHQTAPGRAIVAEVARGGIHGTLQHDRRAVVERMRQRGVGFDPLQSVD